jgi:LacI family transcriptional regulator
LIKRPTQKDVAVLAGVSRSTVSYVLNDQTDQKIPISPETRQRVLDAISELEYEPHAYAQSLRRGHSKTVGVLYPILQNPFFWELLYGISSELQANGYGLHLARHPLNMAELGSSLRELAQYQVDGLCLLALPKTLPPKITKLLRKTGRAVVEVSSTDSEFDHVFHSYGQGTRLLMNYLFELGHRRIAFVYGVAGRIEGHDRLDTYREVLENAGLAVDETLIEHCGDTLEDGYQAAYRLLSRPDRPTALLVINDLLGVGVLRAATDLGMNVPCDVSVASFDDVPFASYTVPRLTTISGHTEQSGRDAVRLLLKRINDPDRPREIVTSQTKLIIRESTGPVPTV